MELGQGCSSCYQGLCERERELVAPVAPAGLRLCREVMSGVLCGGCQSLQTALLNPTSLSPCCRSLRA